MARVLVVDDEPGIRTAVARGLTAEGMEVVAVGDGISGLEAALTGSFDAVVLDIILPGLSGYRVLEQLRAAGVDTPVLLLSAKDGEFDQADGLDLGADDGPADLRGRLQHCLGARVQTPEVGEVGVQPGPQVLGLADVDDPAVLVAEPVDPRGLGNGPRSGSVGRRICHAASLVRRTDVPPDSRRADPSGEPDLVALDHDLLGRQ